jgi:hypothetical protein
MHVCQKANFLRFGTIGNESYKAGRGFAVRED